MLPPAFSWLWKYWTMRDAVTIPYIYMQGWCHEYREIISSGCTLHLQPTPLPPPLFLCPLTPHPHFWTSRISDIFPNCHCCSRLMTHRRSHSEAIPYRAYWKRTSSTIISPISSHSLTLRSCHSDFVKHKICYF